MSESINRQQTCPFLVRIFYKRGAHHLLSEYAPYKLPSEEMQIHTWKDATLQEISSFLTSLSPEYARSDMRFDFRSVFQVVHGKDAGFRKRDLGIVSNSISGIDDKKTLSDVRFMIGDFLDVAIYQGPLPTNIRDRIGNRIPAEPRSLKNRFS